MFVVRWEIYDRSKMRVILVHLYDYKDDLFVVMNLAGTGAR